LNILTIERLVLPDLKIANNLNFEGMLFTMNNLLSYLNLINFNQAVIISAAVFLSDALSHFFMVKRKISAEKDGASDELYKKLINFLQFVIIGLAFHVSSENTQSCDPMLEKIAGLIVFVPTVPQIVNLLKNIRSLKQTLENNDGKNEEAKIKGEIEEK
jgi:hypothetical protein